MSYNSHSTTTTTEGADSNASILQETRVLQEESLEALRRIRCKTSESKALGNETLEALNGQTKQLESTEANTIELRSSLDKIGKLQDRFAKMNFRFGNRRKAKKELAREEKAKAKKKITTLKFKTGASPIKKESLVSKEDEKAAEANNPASSKRRGSRPKKQPAPGDPRENKNLVVEEPQNDSAGSNQKEIVANHDVAPIKKKKTKIPNSTAKKEHIKKKKMKTSTHNLPKDKEAATVPLSDQDQLELREIRDTDNFIDAGIDALGDEVAELLALSLTMGEVANHQNGKLETIDTNLETTGAQTNLLNKRVQLFTATTR